MFILNSKGRLLPIDRPMIMGILNRTPDSFYSGSRVGGDDALLEHAGRMIGEGADWLDIGGQSTRPGAATAGEEEELQRTVGAITLLHRKWPDVPLSVDTWRARVAQEAVAAGASIVNDISGLLYDPELGRVAAEGGAAIVLMHTRGRSRGMYELARYDDTAGDVARELAEAIGQIGRAHV